MATPDSGLLTRRVAEVIDKTSLARRLQGKNKLRIKLGIDPTRPDLHVGHAVPLLKLREFQDAGHTAVLIIGDITATIGDPSGKDETRPPITPAEVKKNALAFFKQAYLILDRQRIEIRRQSEWYRKFGVADIIRLAARVSVGKLLAHETFRQRLSSDQPFAMHEILYPLLQGYDSVAVRADVELGGLDQKFNVLMGRTMQKSFGQEPQDVILMPYLIGLDGKEKMGKSLGNYIALADTADEMFGKVMSLPDGLIPQYFELCTGIPQAELSSVRQQLGDKHVNPRDLKVRLAKTIVAFYHSVPMSDKAEANFEKKFGKGKNAGTIQPDKTLKKPPGNYPIIEILVEGQLAASKSEARRKLAEGAVALDGVVIDAKTQTAVSLQKGTVIRLGKRFLKIV